MDAYYCDVCHAVLSKNAPVYALYRAMGHSQFETGFGERVNLCERCSDQFDDWVDGRAVIKEDSDR